MINQAHAKRVLEHQRGTPQLVIARWLAMTGDPSPQRMAQALDLIKWLVKAGYAIEPIEDDDEN